MAIKAMTSHGRHLKLASDDKCTGCAGCSNACPNDALKMRLSSEGFYRPEHIEERCNYCGICEILCPVLATEFGVLQRAPWTDPKCFAAWSTDSETQLTSSSGGVFTEISRLVIENGGVIFGCSWNESLEPEHIAVMDFKGIGKLRGSKYIPSNVGQTLSQAVDFARIGKQVLFSGTPCQVAAISQLLDPHTRNNTVLVDFICHGVPSLRLFSLYKRWVFRGKQIVGFTFRDKSLGLQTIIARSSCGRVYKRNASADPFFRLGYGYHLSMMYSCFKCRFSGIPRISDITLGDFWGAPKELDDPKGVSVVLVNSLIGESLISKSVASGALKIKSTELAIVAQKNSRATGGEWRLPQRRSDFLKDVVSGHSFLWIYWRWYAPIRTFEKIKSILLGSLIWLYRVTRVKKVFMLLRRSF